MKALSVFAASSQLSWLANPMDRPDLPHALPLLVLQELLHPHWVIKGLPLNNPSVLLPRSLQQNLPQQRPLPRSPLRRSHPQINLWVARNRVDEAICLPYFFLVFNIWSRQIIKGTPSTLDRNTSCMASSISPSLHL